MDASLAVLAALSLEAYQRLYVLANELYGLDKEVSQGLAQLSSSPDAARAAVAQILPPVQEAYRQFPLEITDILKDAVQKVEATA